MGEQGEALEELEEHMPRTRPVQAGTGWSRVPGTGRKYRDEYLHCEGLRLALSSSSRQWQYESIVKERGRKLVGTIYKAFFVTRVSRYCFGGESGCTAALPGRTDRGGETRIRGLRLHLRVPHVQGQRGLLLVHDTTQYNTNT